MNNQIPHIVKFSGGRSSAMMLMNLLKQGTLDPKRGDVIVFNNTSAEHSATYEFTRKIKKIAEEKYNIPFFWVEYQSYEDAGKNGWQRVPSYKLVNDMPHSVKNKNGYCFKGEVFEEMVSLTGFVPNMQNRTCTLSMKIFTTNAFLNDWFAQKQGIERLGHYRNVTMLTDNSIFTTHKMNGGSTPRQIVLDKKKFVRKRDFIRENSLWKDFTSADLCFDNTEIKKSVIGNKGQLFGDRAITYNSYLGIRKDEQHRVVKIKARINDAKNKNTTSLFSQPPNEIILTPLIDSNADQQSVTDFWDKQTFNLELPNNGLFSNCVYCPLKGKAKLLKIAKEEVANGLPHKGTPASIDWWIKMEKRYARDMKAEGRSTTADRTVNYIGFFGATKERVYKQLKNQSNLNDVEKSVKAEFLEDEDYIPCNCTD